MVLETAPVAAYSEMVRLDRGVGPFLDLKVAQDVLVCGVFDFLVDGVEDPFCAFGREMDLIVHVLVSEVEVVERNVMRANLVGASFQFRP